MLSSNKCELSPAASNPTKIILPPSMITGQLIKIMMAKPFKPSAGDGKRVSTVVTKAESPELSAAKRTVAIQLADVFCQ